MGVVYFHTASIIVIISPTVENIWSGLQDFAEDGNFVWSSSLQAPDYTHWHANEPNNSGGREDCVEITSTGEWNDRPCDDYKGYPLCEQL